MSFPRYERYKDSGVEWLGEVPEHWVPKKLGSVAAFRGGGTPTKANRDFWDGDIPWVSPKDMKGEYVEKTEDGITEAALASRATTLISPGAVLMVVRSGILKHTIPVAINRIPVTLNQDMKAIVIDPAIGLSEFFLRWVQGLNELLLNVWLKQGATVESVEHLYLSNTGIPFPPISEQQNICKFLESETAKIDELIKEQRRLIELLKEKRQAVISHAVTKGLRPAMSMKDSDVGWIGHVPQNWTVLSLGRVTTSACDGPFGSGLKSDHYSDSGIRVIRLQNIRDGAFDATDAVFIDPTHYADLGEHDVRSGDLLIAGLGDDRHSVGRACVAPLGIEPAMVKADCFRFRLNADAVSEFVAAQLSIGAPTDAGRLATGSTRSRIPLSKMSSRTIAIPGTAEQSAIVAYLRSRELEFVELRSEATLSIDLLQERRSALISAAVTGKIDVRQYIPKEAT